MFFFALQSLQVNLTIWGSYKWRPVLWYLILLLVHLAGRPFCHIRLNTTMTRFTTLCGRSGKYWCLSRMRIWCGTYYQSLFYIWNRILITDFELLPLIKLVAVAQAICQTLSRLLKQVRKHFRSFTLPVVLTSWLNHFRLFIRKKTGYQCLKSVDHYQVRDSLFFKTKLGGKSISLNSHEKHSCTVLVLDSRKKGLG